MKVLFLINDVNHLSVISPLFLVTSSMKEHQGLFLLISPKTQEFIVSLMQCKLPIDPYLEDRHARLDINSDQDHLVLVNSILNTDPHWVLENDLEM
jgi:hypothetical protein